ncbi:MAG: HAD-IB family hydrolase [Gammaproteobacteria bacterium]|nr:HAD-IB family hydrolase [Gammaproteobacteria bacterium]
MAGIVIQVLQENTVTQASSLAIFDLDNTLLGGDSDHAWGEFLIERGLVDATEHRQQNDAFYAAYCDGSLDIHAYLEFALRPLAGKTPTDIKPLQREFMQQMIEPMRLPLADTLLQMHRARGDHLLIITATNELITRPIASWLGVADLLACEAEIINGRYTGKPHGIPCFQQGKVQRLQAWLADKPFMLEQATFYSDSHNDLPLLEAVAEPVAVDADETLQALAKSRGWRMLSLREPKETLD